MLSTQTHNELFKSYNFSRDLSWIRDKCNSSDEEQDLVFVCNQEKVSVNFCSAITIFPHLQDVFKSFSSDFFTTRDAKIFVSLDDSVDPDIFRRLIQSFCHDEEFIMSTSVLDKVKDLLMMFGANLKHFKVVEMERKSDRDVDSKESVSPDTITNGETSQLEKRENVNKFFDNLSKRPVVKKRKMTKKTAVGPIQPLEVKDETPAEARNKEQEQAVGSVLKVHEQSNNSKKTGGTKRKKNILEAVENITAAKKRALEDKESVKDTENHEKQKKSKVSGRVSDDTPRVSADEGNKGSSVKYEIQKLLPQLSIIPLGEKSTPEIEEVSVPAAAPPATPELVKDVEADQAQKAAGDMECPEDGCNFRTSCKTRTDVLHHLVQAHYSDLINTHYPFVKDQSCTLCPSNKTRKTISKDKQSWMKHILTHEALLELFSPELRKFLVSIPKRLRANTNTKKISLPASESITLDETPADRTGTDSDNTNLSFIEDTVLASTASSLTDLHQGSFQESEDLTDSTEAAMEEKAMSSLGPQELPGKPLATSTYDWESKFHRVL